MGGKREYVRISYHNVKYESVDRRARYSKHSDELHANKTWTNTLTPLSRADPAGRYRGKQFRTCSSSSLATQGGGLRTSPYSSTKSAVF